MIHINRFLCAGLLVVLLAPACRKESAPPASSPASGRAATRSGKPGPPGIPAKGDAILLAEAPIDVPAGVLPDLDAMGIDRLYVAAATLSTAGRFTPLPPPPEKLTRPVILVLMGEPGTEALIRGKGDAVAEGWSGPLRKIVSEARTWGDVVGVHLHVLPAPSPTTVPILADLLRGLRKTLALPISVTLPSGASPEAWKPLAGAVDEALVFGFGRRPETGDRMVTELTEAAARSFPVPYRLMMVLGGYGRGGKDGDGKRMHDGEIDRLSEDRNLDFDFGQVLSAEPGNIYKFKPRLGLESQPNLLSISGGHGLFHILTLSDAVKVMSGVTRWGGPNYRGRVFVLDGVPRDGHLLGFPALRAILSGKPYDPRLTVEILPGASARGTTDFSLRVTNAGPSPSELSHFNNVVKVRVEGGTILNVRPGDFDRFELATRDSDGGRPAPFGRAVVCHLFENFWAPEEANTAGPIRVSGGRPKVFVSYKMSLPDGKVVDGPEVEATVAAPPPPAAKPKPAGKKR